MHSHDRTLLSKLGFSDRDKQDSRHDIACAYLATPACAEKLCRLYVPSPSKQGSQSDKTEEEYVLEFDYRSASVQLERPIGKGSGEYRTTIGFVDLVVVGGLVGKETQRKCRAFDRYNPHKERGAWEERPDREYPTGLRPLVVAVEVKIGRVGIGDLLRQIGLYREYMPPEPAWEYRAGPHWVAATAYDLNVDEVASLKRANVMHVRLGAGFDAYCDSLVASPPPIAASVEM